MAAVAALGSHNFRSASYVRKTLNNRVTSVRSPVNFTSNFNDLGTGKQDEAVIINVSGYRYETRASTLARFPDTLLGNPLKRREFYDEETKEYFFDRNRKTFGAILEFYQTGGVLRRPDNIVVHRFLREILFYQLGDDIVKLFLEMEEMLEEQPVIPENEIQRKLWTALEVPSSSLVAQFLAGLNISIVFTAITNLCVQTLPYFRENLNDATHSNIPLIYNGEGFPRSAPSKATGTPFFVIESVCTTYFCLDLLTRFSVSPTKKSFFLKFMNIVDVFSVIPFLADLGVSGVVSSTKAHYITETLDLFMIFRIFRLLQIFRILKLSRYSDGLQILWLTVKSARQELSVLFLLMAIGMILASAAVYYAESGEPGSEFLSIPHAFWWTVITWTAVGYGDMIPKHAAGRLVGGICSVCGVVCLAFIVPVAVAHFEYYFHRKYAHTLEK